LSDKGYNRAYYAANREKERARSLAWYRANRRRRKEAGRLWREENREHVNEQARARYAADAERKRAHSRDTSFRHRLAQHGMTVTDYEVMFAAQGFRCAICRTGKPTSRHGWQLDHDHRTGAVLGILCHKCNLALGAVDDQPPVLRAMIAYLEKE
jgi:hypothetical protein